VPLLLVSVVGGGGWFLQRLETQLHGTTQRLVETETSLAQSQESLTTLEAERKKLSDAYDALKVQLTKTEEERKQAAHQSEQLTANLDQLSKDRAQIQHDLEAAKGTQGQLKQQADALYNEVANTEAKKTTLELQLKEAQVRVNELEAQSQQLTQERQVEETRLRGQLAELSHAYERLARVPGAESEELTLPALADRAPAVAHEQTPVSAAAETVRPRTPGGEQLARHYRDLGESYLATEQYRKAAEAFERSLLYHDDPDVHTRLEFIYTRLLPSPQQARRHALLASPDRHSLSGLQGSANAQGLPRSGWQFLWDWLLGK